MLWLDTTQRMQLIQLNNMLLIYHYKPVGFDKYEGGIFCKQKDVINNTYEDYYFGAKRRKYDIRK